MLINTRSNRRKTDARTVKVGNSLIFDLYGIISTTVTVRAALLCRYEGHSQDYSRLTREAFIDRVPFRTITNAIATFFKKSRVTFS